MNAQPLFTKDQKPTAAWFCEKCRRVWSNEYDANHCCTCLYCGKEIEREKGTGFSTSHHACFQAETNKRYAEQLAKATEVGPDYEGFVYCEHGGPRDGYAEDIESMAEWWADQIADGELEREQYPEFVLTCKPEPPRQIDTLDLLDWICEDGYEDMRDGVEIPDGLEDLLKKFNDANAHLVSWMIDHTRKVKMPPLEFDQEQLAAIELHKEEAGHAEG